MAITHGKLALFGGKPVLARRLPPYNSIGKEEKTAVERLMDKVAAGKATLSGFLARGGERFYGGPLVRKLESDFSRFFGVKYAVSFNSATTALQAAVAAAGIGPGDEVITSPLTMSATPAAVLFNGAIPVFADVDPNNYCLSAKTIEKKITRRTKAILAVNLLGGSADYEPILRLAKRHKLVVIEDNAQAPGAAYRGRFTGTIGDIGVLSFNIHKAIQAGEGGMILTNNSRYAYRAQLVRNHGEFVVDDYWKNGREWREFILGSNFRFTEIAAAIMIEQLKKLNALNRERIVLADYLTEKLKEFSWLSPVNVLPDSKHVYYLYPIKFFEGKIGILRKTFVRAMEAEGFPLGEGYNRPLYLLPIYQQKRIYDRSQLPFVSKDYLQRIDYQKGMCPVTERLYNQELLTTTLCQPPKTKKTIDLFLEALKKIENNVEGLKRYKEH